MQQPMLATYISSDKGLCLLCNIMVNVYKINDANHIYLYERYMDMDSLEFYRDAYQRSPLAMSSINPVTNKYVQLNAKFEELTGYSKDELLNMTVYDLYDDACHDNITEALLEFKKTNKIINKRMIIRRKDDIAIAIILNAEKVHLVNDTIVSNAVMYEPDHIQTRDIEITRAEFNTMFNNLPIIVWVSDVNGLVKYYNDTWDYHIAFPKEECLGLNGNKALHPDDRGWVMEKWLRCCEQRQSYEAVHRLLNKDGTYHTYLCKSNPTIINGEIIGWIGSALDTNEIMGTSTTVVQSINSMLVHYIQNSNDITSFRQNILNELVALTNSHCGFVTRLFDTKQKIITVSDYLNNMPIQNWSSDIQTVLSNRFVVDDLYKYNIDDSMFITQIVSQKKGEYIFNDLDNLTDQFMFLIDDHVPKHMMCFPMIHNNNTMGCIYLFNDSTPYKRDMANSILPLVHAKTCIEMTHKATDDLKYEQAKKIELIESVAKAKTNFLTSMSHEIRTPMNGLFGILSILKDTNLSVEQHDYLRLCINSAESLLSVLDDILLFTKADANAIELEEVNFNLTDLVEDVLSIMSSNIKPTQDLDLAYFIRPDVPLYLIGDPNRLRQILNNLISNAIKFTQLGDISIDVTLASNVPLVLQFEVSDTGIGMSEEQTQKLFQPFSQVDAGIARKYGGSGLGLSICKQLVEIFNGQISIQSRLGRGSTFTFTVQLKQDTSVNSNKLPFDLSEEDAEKLKTLNVFILDDNATNCIALSTLLNNLGVNVDYSRSGHETIDKLKAAAYTNNPYDVLLLDYKMPTMNGVEVAQALDESNIQLKIIGISSMHDNAILQKEPNVHICMHKPLRIKQLLYYICRSVHVDKIVPKHDKIMVMDKTILVVEDNPTNRMVLCEMLSQSGFNTVEVQTGMDALDAIQSHDKFYAILMDIHMPNMDGIITTQKLIEMGYDVPVLALSADISPNTKNKALKAGVVKYLTKPLTKRTLVHALNNIVLRDTPAKSFLIVDDVKTNVIVANHYIKQLFPNAEIKFAYGGAEAIELAKNHDVILMDVHMQDIDGLEATQRIREDGFSGLIIGITGDDDYVSCMTAGMDHCIIKPLSVDKLRNALEDKIIFDITVLESMIDMDKNLVQLLLKKWCDTVSIQIDNLNTTNINALVDSARSIKGSARQLGLMMVSNTAQKLEEIPTQKMLLQLKSAFDKTHCYINNLEL